jgi:phosphoribosylformimino-5-aminoimidazole carboxamide ribotide isomerase
LCTKLHDLLKIPEDKMLIIPAIDLIDGKCVRLTEGNFSEKKTYDGNPLDIALQFKDAGAKRIHIVDLDGAKSGLSKNREIIIKIKKETGLIVETGGGIRSLSDIEELAGAGIDFLILGTILTEKLGEVESWILKYGKNLVAGIDAKNGMVQTRGWMKDEGLDAAIFGKKLKEIGFESAVFTDISKDGKLQGPNIDETKKFGELSGLNVILSGGVSSDENVKDAKKAIGDKLTGVIIGKAFYEGKIDLKDVIRKYQD